MSKLIESKSNKLIEKAQRKALQTRLERAVDLYGSEHGRMMNAIYEIGISKPFTFTERLEIAYDIIKLNNKK